MTPDHRRDSAMQGFLPLFLIGVRNSITNWQIAQLWLTVLEEFTFWNTTNASKLFAQSSEVRQTINTRCSVFLWCFLTLAVTTERK